MIRICIYAEYEDMKSKYICYGDNGWLVLDVKDAYLTIKDHDDKIESIFLQNILNKMSKYFII